MSADRIELLIIVIVAVAIIARRLRLPYTVGLLFAGVGLGFLPGNEQLRLTRELIFSFLLPPLVFEAAINLNWSKLKKELLFVSVLATFGLAIAAGIVAVGMHLVVGWSILSCTVFAVLIAATDPVSVIAAFKESGQTGRTRLLVEAESLLNDGTAAVAFSVALAVGLGAQVSFAQVVWQFVASAGGGILAGAMVAAIGLLIAGKAEEYLVEIAVTVAVCYGSFLLAEHFHLSGVLATMTAGLIAGKYRSEDLFTERGVETLDTFWEFAAFAANSVVFLLIGLRATRVPVTAFLWPTAVAIILVLAGRAASVYGLCALFSRSPWSLGRAGQHLLFWGGLRGALALALVLGVPETMGPEVSQITVVTLGVVVFSVVVQGLTIRPIIERASTA